MVAQQHGRRVDGVLGRDLDDGLGLHQRPARAAQRAVGHDVDALGLAQVDDLLLRQRRVVLDLVDGRDHGAVGEELLEVALAVLRTVSWRRLPPGGGSLTLQTPMALVLPVASSFSMAFHVSTWLWLWMMSRSPLGSLGNLSSLPVVRALCQGRPRGQAVAAGAY